MYVCPGVSLHLIRHGSPSAGRSTDLLIAVSTLTPVILSESSAEVASFTIQLRALNVDACCPLLHSYDERKYLCCASKHHMRRQPKVQPYKPPWRPSSIPRPYPVRPRGENGARVRHGSLGRRAVLQIAQPPPGQEATRSRGPCLSSPHEWSPHFGSP